MKQNIRRLWICMSCILLVWVYPMSAMGKWVAVYYQGYPSSVLISVDENSPISVIKEDLSFDFSNAENTIIDGLITATYIMENPTQEDLTVQMAFPLIMSGDLLKYSNINIFVDETPINYDLYMNNASIKEGREFMELSLEEVLKSLEDGQYFSGGVGDIPNGSTYTSPHIWVLLYSVEFLAGSQREVTVQYPATVTYDAEKTLYPTYTYEYFLSPAKYWADFGTLNVSIIPDEYTQYLIDSSIPFVQNQDGTYSASLEGLPDGELVFELCAREDPNEPKSSSNSTTSNDDKSTPLKISPILILLFVFALVLIAVTVVFIVKARRRRQDTNMEE